MRPNITVTFRDRWIPFTALFKREAGRFLRIWMQTIITPVITTSLYLIIFGVSLGQTIELSKNLSYLEFIVPGLIVMGIINTAAASASFSILISKVNQNIVDTLVSPINHIGTALGHALAGTVRGLLVAVVIFIVSLLFGGTFPAFPILAIIIAFLTAFVFTTLGAIVGVFGKQFEHLNAFMTFILLPLIYLGGVFYSLEILPTIWQAVSKFNPIFYIIDSFRFAFLGISDVSPWFSLLVIIAVAIILFFALAYIFKKGWGLRN